MFTDNERLLAGQLERIGALERRIRDALLHYQIGWEASALFAAEQAEAVVSWRHVAECMAKALRGEAATPVTGARTHERDGGSQGTCR